MLADLFSDVATEKKMNKSLIYEKLKLSLNKLTTLNLINTQILMTEFVNADAGGRR